MCVCVCVCMHARTCTHSVAQSYLTLISWTTAHQAPLSREFFRQEYWNRLPFPMPGDLPDPGMEPVSLVFPVLVSGFFTTKVADQIQRQFGPSLLAGSMLKNEDSSSLFP